MPASHKMLKSRQQAANRAAGIGDEQGRLPSKVKTAEVMARCTICSQEIRMTKKNIEAVSHFSSRHPASTFAACFPGQFDPTAVAVAAPAPAAGSTSASTATTPSVAASSADAPVSVASDGSTSSVFVADATTSTVTAAAPAPKPAKKKPAQDLSFLDAALDPKAVPGKKK